MEQLSEGDVLVVWKLDRLLRSLKDLLHIMERVRDADAPFCDRRYDTVFVYHNGAESYYAARAFRGSLRV